MSKKNKNKRKLSGEPEIAAAAEASTAAKPADSMDDDLKREFKHLARTITFILVLLVGLYYYDQQSHILKAFTGQLLGLF